MKTEYKTLAHIRHQVFEEVARIAYNGNDFSQIESLPYKIIPGEVATYRDSIFLERAIIGERIRLAMGLSLRPVDQPEPISKNIEDALKAEKYYEPPLINIIKFACNACKTKGYEVSNGCQGCLAHPCIEVCPKKCISFVDGKAFIDQEKCIKCGLCHQACPYGAILKHERPCALACGMDAIGSDQFGRAEIDYDKCVSCGMCLVNCPFGAIADKSQIVQLIQAINSNHQVIAVVAPSFEGQFGRNVSFGAFKQAMQRTGFDDVVEVAIGADLCTIEEAEDFLAKVPASQPFMATSCCPSWSMMAKKQFPEFSSYISMALTPMVLTARLVRESHPEAKIVFVGPCSAKKLEASRKSVRSEVDFVITFEELAGMFGARDVDIAAIEDTTALDNSATRDGRGFAVGGGVANAVANLIKKKHPDMEVKIKNADGLRECGQMLKDAKKGLYDGYLLEGMGCPGGCVAGAGCYSNSKMSALAVKKAAGASALKTSDESIYSSYLYLLNESEKK